VVKVHVGLVPASAREPTEDSGDNQGDDDAQIAALEAQVAARHEFKAALGNSLRQHPADAALMLTIHMARPYEYATKLFREDMYSSTYLPPDLFNTPTAPLRAVPDGTMRPNDKNQVQFKDAASMASALSALLADPETDAIAAAIEALAHRIEIGDYHAIHPALLAYARHRHIPIPAYAQGPADGVAA